MLTISWLELASRRLSGMVTPRSLLTYQNRSNVVFFFFYPNNGSVELLLQWDSRTTGECVRHGHGVLPADGPWQ